MDTFSEIAENYLSKTSPDVESYLHDAFLYKLLEAGKTPEDSQARAAITGQTFENCIDILFEHRYPNVSISRQVDLEKAYLTGQSGADFVLYETSKKNNIKCIIEAKGSAEELHWPSGEIQQFTRPGLRRTDTVKKAVCQAYQVKKGYPDTKFVILTTHLPKENSSGNKILKLAEGDIIDTIINITDIEELDQFIQKI